MNELERFSQIEAFIFDVDGVMTDGSVFATESGELMRRFHVKDGYAIRRAIIVGKRVIVISGGDAKGTHHRLYGLGIREIWLGESNKLQRYEAIVNRLELDEGHILYMGDDLPDYKVMRRVGFACCPSDAAPEIIELSQYVSPRPGGGGCVRDVIEKTLRIQQLWSA